MSTRSLSQVRRSSTQVKNSVVSSNTRDSPSCSPLPTIFRSTTTTPQAKQPGNNLINAPLRKNAQKERALYETPKVDDKKIEAIIKGRKIIPLPRDLELLRFWLPFIFIPLLILVFVIPPVAYIFTIVFGTWIYALIKIKIYERNQENIKIIPKISF